jgi:hypothetical protein
MLFAPFALRSLKTLRALGLGKNKLAVMLIGGNAEYKHNYTLSGIKS